LLQRNCRAALGKGETNVIRARRIGGQVSAAMGGADLEAGKAVERALEDQVGERERRLERVADGVLQPAVAPQAALQLGGALRMNEDQHAELLRPGPEGMELPVRQLCAVHAATDAGAAQAELPHAVLELLHGELRDLQ